MPLARQIWSKRCTRYRAVQPSRFFGKSANWIPLSVSTVCSRYGTAASSASRKRTAVGRSALSCNSTKANFELAPFGYGLWIDAVALGQRSQALLTTLYCSTDCLCRRGAAMKNLAQSASLHAGEKKAPSKPGTKHLGAEGQISQGEPRRRTSP